MLKLFRKVKYWFWHLLFRWMNQNDPLIEGVRGRVPVGNTVEEQLVFWNKVKNWLDQPEGKYYTAFQEKEFEAAYDELMHINPKSSKVEDLWFLLGRVQQQNAVFVFASTVARRIQALQQQVKKKQEAE